MQKLHGISGASGEAMGKVFVFERAEISLEKKSLEDVQAEVDKFLKIQEKYAEELNDTYEKSVDTLGKDAAQIFLAYRAIAMDKSFFKKAMKTVESEKVCMEYAIAQEKNRVVQKFEKMTDPYMRERAGDISNVCDELIRRLQGKEDVARKLADVDYPYIIVARDLSPEDTVKMDKACLKGFVTEQGGVTSHTVILAKTLGIPAIVGVQNVMSCALKSQMVYLNGGSGEVVFDPDEQTMKDIEQMMEQEAQKRALFDAYAKKEAMTKDGRRVKVCVNTGDADSMKTFSAECCDGIGLFRTEFLYMNETDYPDEEKQFGVYKKIAEAAKGKEVIIRTLDIGGDKQLAYMNLPEESNPFLGYRAIRLCLDRKEMFKQQLRAVLRASAFGNIKIMFPMIVTVEEFQEARKMVEDAKAELKKEGIPFEESIDVGLMIETPAAVQISDKLAKYADFFSIGTNDLIQYTTATDRMNEKVQYLYDVCNISVLNSINTVIRNAHKEGIPVGMCGEAASDEKMIPLFLGMGLDEFSIVPGRIGAQKYLLSQMNYEEMRKLPGEVLGMDTIREVHDKLESILKSNPC